MKKDKTLIIGLIVAAAIAAIAFVAISNKKKKDSAPLIDQGDPEPGNNNPVPSTPVPSTPTPKALNKDLVLKKGSSGIEVKELQKLLGFTGGSVDGIFGNQTESALYAKKGVKEISLNGYPRKPDLPKTILKVGDKVMANKNGVKVYLDKLLDDKKTHYNTGNLEDTYDFGEKIGTIKLVSPNKTHYIVEDTDIVSPDWVWVSTSDVTKM